MGQSFGDMIHMLQNPDLVDGNYVILKCLLIQSEQIAMIQALKVILMEGVMGPLKEKYIVGNRLRKEWF